MSRWPAGYGRVILSETGSTLDAARQLAREQPAPFWVLAHHQTAARGRRGRPWAMSPGNFAATLVLQAEEPPGVAALRSFVMSLALFEAFTAVTGRGDFFQLKWPNDVLLQGGKVAGILLESSGQGTQQSGLCIGVGVNLAAAPAPGDVETGAVTPVALSEVTGTSIGAEDFLGHLAEAYAVLEAQFRQFGFAPIRAAWLAHAARLGEVITARTGRESLTGTFEDVDAEGHLMLRTHTGLRRIAAAEVFF